MFLILIYFWGRERERETGDPNRGPHWLDEIMTCAEVRSFNWLSRPCVPLSGLLLKVLWFKSNTVTHLWPESCSQLSTHAWDWWRVVQMDYTISKHWLVDKSLFEQTEFYWRYYYLKPPVFLVYWQNKAQDDFLPPWIIPLPQTFYTLIVKFHWTAHQTTKHAIFPLLWLCSFYGLNQKRLGPPLGQVWESVQMPPTSSGHSPWYC